MKTKIEIGKKLSEIGLNSENSVVIGSGILQALGIRESKDIDLVVTEDEYERLKQGGKLTTHMTQYKKEVLKDNLFEIGTSWGVLNKEYKFEDFENDCVIIDGVRYITLDFLYKAKESWLKGGTARPKDINDLKLIEEYKDRSDEKVMIANELLDLVDENGNVIGQATRGECHNNPKLIHQVAHCWIFNKNGQILWQQRSLKKDGAAGAWDMSVGGHVPSGEKPEQTLHRELKEELNVENVDVNFVERYLRGNEKQTELISLYYAVIDKPESEFKFDLEETQQVKWINPWEAQLQHLNKELESTDFIITQVTRILQSIFVKGKKINE